MGKRLRRSWAPVPVVPVVVVLLLAASGGAQTRLRHATNIAAIAAYPGFFHLRSIVLVGTVAQQANGDIRLSDSSGSLRVIPQGSAPDGVDEVRGVFWDLGRMKADDPRLAPYDLRAVFHVDPDGAWPRPGEVTAILASAVAPAPPPLAAGGSASEPAAVPIRALVLDAARYIDQPVTITGQYDGRNLAGELPDTPRQSRYDFVLRSGDAAIWIANMRPKVKDSRGKEYELGLDARIDTSRWLRVSGTLQQGRGLLWIDGQAGTLALASPPTTPADAEADGPVRVPAAAPPEVVFSAPTQDETDVSLATSIRIQFSRDVDAATIKGNVHVTYLPQAGAPPASGAPIDFTTDYAAANRVLEVKFGRPLDPFRTVKVELGDGMLGTDKQPLKPWTLTFALGS
jgi:Big-like domain-containing protein